MKATGIVRRIDDLGRVVIPKEIRRTMRVREGDPLEIYMTEDGGVCFRKYSPMACAEDVVKTAMRMADLGNHEIAIYDRDFRITGDNDFPNAVASQWENINEYCGMTDKYSIYPIDVSGERLGYVVSKSNNVGITTIRNYLAISFEN